MILSLLTLLLIDYTLQLETTYKAPDLEKPFYFDATPERLYVLDVDTSHVHYWDMSGAYLGKFSQKGEGPGELLYAGQIICFKDQIIIMDPCAGKVHYFDLQHQYLKSAPMIGRSIFWKTDQSLLVHQASTSRGKENAYLADDNFKSTKPLGEKKYRKFERIDKVNYIFRPFANEFRPAASSNRVYLGQSQENEIKVFDGKGDFLGKYHIPVKRRKVPDEEKDIYKNAYASQPATLEFGEAPYVDRIIAFEDQVVVIQDGKGQVFDLNFKKLGDLDAYLGSTGDLIAFRAVGKRLISISYGEEEVHLIQSFKVVPKKTK